MFPIPVLATLFGINIQFFHLLSGLKHMPVNSRFTTDVLVLDKVELDRLHFPYRYAEMS
ncbi:hypothetical protein [Ulvibacterium sp.]|uniref:hypothetical protein n=1 Tax=Ulvibacterium sp. TaxID=2665914 RepID=UPI00262BB477|nr:hypothetical protein [Ulvibacterium sp.]